MKRKIFIGSSKEGLKIAEKVQKCINNKCSEWLECEAWNGGFVFEINKGTLECLIKASRKYDYGIFIASKDDISIKRLRLHHTTRDNVLFEMGLFLGSLGLNRAFLITHDKVHMPSDFNGVTQIRYNDKKNIEKLATEVIEELIKTKDSYCLKPVPSAALALGYFDSYVLKISEKLHNENSQYKLEILIPSNLDDINSQINVYKKTNPSLQKYSERPTIYGYNEKPFQYWDIPTTLQTLNNLINMMISSTEIGINHEKDEWLQYELRNFVGALKVLIERHPICKENATVKYL